MPNPQLSSGSKVTETSLKSITVIFEMSVITFASMKLKVPEIPPLDLSYQAIL